ncbi:MAG: helix-turn-helix transcriptional regulator [Alphaproteobacteria bacterium]|nr:helix-turn-helix transcriptional regulator [Alphaproteobacteria bacterium]
MNVYEQLATRIRTLRNERDWLQEELADRADLHRTYISHIENGKRELSVETLCKIANGFDISPSELMKNVKY